MIYVFEGGSVVYDGSTITDEQKAEAVAVEVLPVAEVIEGKIAELRANKAEGKVYYEYVDKPKDSEIEQLKENITRLEEENLMNMMGLVDLHMMVIALGGGQ